MVGLLSPNTPSLSCFIHSFTHPHPFLPSCLPASLPPCLPCSDTNATVLAGDVPDKHEPALTRFRMAVTNTATSNDEIQAAQQELQQALRAMGLADQVQLDLTTESNIFTSVNGWSEDCVCV